MKYIILLLSVIMTTTAAVCQKKNVDYAQKLIGSEKIKEARSYIKEAMTTHPTDSDARTWHVAGLLEWRSYANDIRKLQINPKDASVSDDAMASKLLDGLSYLTTALRYDTLPDKKGKVKPRFKSNILDELNAHSFALYRAGAIKYNGKKYYPEAYTGFKWAADLASVAKAKGMQCNMPDSLVADSYYFAGISAWQGQAIDSALLAFNRAIEYGIDDPEVYMFKMAVWENKIKQAPTLEALKDSLLATSLAGYSRYGIKNHSFLTRAIDVMNYLGRTQQALEMLNKQITATPDEMFLYSLRANVNELLGNDDDAMYDYLKSAESSDADALTLMRGAHKLFRMGVAHRDNITGTRKQQAAMRKAIIEDFLEPAHEMATRAQSLTTDPDEMKLIDNLLENIDYAATLLK